MLLVYTGNGKGKTSASVGQAIRAHGRGLRVAFGQFMKRGDQSGEQPVLASLLGDRFRAGGPGFFRREEERATQREAALAVMRWAESLLPCLDMLVLDEVLYALGYEFVSKDELLALVEKAEKSSVHLVLSGRGLPDWLEARADLVTEMGERTHPFAKGRKSEPGIEY